MFRKKTDNLSRRKAVELSKKKTRKRVFVQNGKGDEKRGTGTVRNRKGKKKALWPEETQNHSKDVFAHRRKSRPLAR